LGLLPACTRSDGRKPVYPVHGQVHDSDNKPAAGALVVFHPAAAGATETLKPVGYVDDTGTFTLTTYQKDDGAPEGEYVVTIEWRPRPANPFDKKDQPDRLHGRYSDPKTSPLRAKIDKQPDNVVPPIQLK
jgi:hypothetical protein